MPYATPDQVRGVLAADEDQQLGTPAELEDDVLAARIAAASAQVDAAVSARYNVPFSDPVPALVTHITVAIASWLAALTYRRSVDLTATDPITLRYQWAVGLLAQITNGTADLPGAGSGDDPGTPSGGRRSGIAINPYRGTLFDLRSVGLTERPSGRVRVRDSWDGYE